MTDQARIDALEHAVIALMKREVRISEERGWIFDSAQESIMGSNGPGGPKEKTEAVEALRHLRYLATSAN